MTKIFVISLSRPVDGKGARRHRIDVSPIRWLTAAFVVRSLMTAFVVCHLTGLTAVLCCLAPLSSVCLGTLTTKFFVICCALA